MHDYDNISELDIQFSRKFKIKMNRLFREVAGIEKIPHPEVDTVFERIRSKIVVKLHLEHFIYKKK